MRRTPRLKNHSWKEYAKLIRLQSLGVSTPPVIGALTVTGHQLGIPQFFLLFIVGITAHIFGFVLNDYCDIKLDKTSKYLSERPLVKGVIQRKSVFTILILCLFFGFGISFLFFRNLPALTALLAATAMGSLYNLFGKRLIGSDILAAGATAALVIFGACAVSENMYLFRTFDYLTWIIALTGCIQMLYMNIVDGGLKDADHDYRAGVKTLAVTMGVRANDKLRIPFYFKMLGYLLRSLSIILILIPFLGNDDRFQSWPIIILVPLIAGTAIYMVKMLSLTAFDREKIGDYIRLQEFFRYCLIPVMLISHIGLYWSLLMIALPLIWYFLSTWMIYGHWTERPKTL